MSRRIYNAVKTFIYMHFNYDRVAERKIKKSIRIYHKGGKINHLWATLMWNSLQKKYCTSYRPMITVGNNLRIEHCMGTQVGETTIIGNNVRIYQYVQIVAKIIGDQEKKDRGIRRHAKIGDNVILSAGCMIIGPVTIGDNCIIGARAIVTHDIPDNSIVIGVNQIKPRKPGQKAPDYKQ